MAVGRRPDLTRGFRKRVLCLSQCITRSKAAPFPGKGHVPGMSLSGRFPVSSCRAVLGYSKAGSPGAGRWINDCCNLFHGLFMSLQGAG